MLQVVLPPHKLQVVDYVVPFEDLGDAKPKVNQTGDCQVNNGDEEMKDRLDQDDSSRPGCPPTHSPSTTPVSPTRIFSTPPKSSRSSERPHPLLHHPICPGQVQAGGRGEGGPVSAPPAEEAVHGRQYQGDHCLRWRKGGIGADKVGPKSAAFASNSMT